MWLIIIIVCLSMVALCPFSSTSGTSGTFDDEEDYIDEEGL